MKRCNIIYKAELSNETTFLAFKERGTNRLKYRLINTKYKTPADIGLVDLVDLPDCYAELNTPTDISVFDLVFELAPSYGKPGGIRILKSYRFYGRAPQ